ncbi:DUF3299 domain-containing protein [Vibrio sp.]|nr:DUF3299 domain-containing protein [Vibrio sp.]
MKSFTTIMLSLLLLTSTQTFATDTSKKTSSHIANNDEVIQHLKWIDLVPESERAGLKKDDNILNNQHSKNAAPAKQSQSGAVRQELNNITISISGYVIPLEGDGRIITEFLLVPYFGACVHVPPPPPNQILLVKFPQGAPSPQAWDVITVTGTLSTDSEGIGGIQTGYNMMGKQLEPLQGNIE